MAHLTENPVWEEGIYQLEITDPIQGGPGGIDNVQAKQLGNRTLFLKQSIKPTFIIDSDAKLAQWAANASGNNYSRILIKAGAWTYTEPDVAGNYNSPPFVAIDLSDGRTKSVEGESGSKIVINANKNNGMAFVAIKGRVTGTYPNLTRTEPFFYNVDVQINHADCSEFGKSFYGFCNCASLANCSVSFEVPDNGYLENCSAFNKCIDLANCKGSVCDSLQSYVFSQCVNLTNCSGKNRFSDEPYSFQTVSADSCTFESCKNLVNCTAYSFCEKIVSGSEGLEWTGFGSCQNLSGCTAYGDEHEGSYYASNYSKGFSGCTNLENCNAVATTIVDVHTSGIETYGFSHCTNLTNCTGTGKVITEGALYNNEIWEGIAGFCNCKNLTNCTGTGNGGECFAGHGFMGCSYLVNCIGSGYGITGGNNHGINSNYCWSFLNCRTGFGCKKGGGAVLPNWLSATCYMEQTSGGTLWANTAAGGYNLLN